MILLEVVALAPLAHERVNSGLRRSVGRSTTTREGRSDDPDRGPEQRPRVERGRVSSAMRRLLLAWLHARALTAGQW